MWMYFTTQRYFLLPWLVFCIIVIVLHALYPYQNMHLAITSVNHPVSDQVFRWITYLGDGAVLAIPIFTTLLFVHRQAGILMLLGYFISGGIAQLLKREVFDNYARPYSELGHLNDFHAVEGISHNLDFSFPSGHATTAFFFFGILAFYSRKNYLKFWLFIVALLVAYSRVQLSQHYLRDIAFGSLIGVSTALFVFAIRQKLRIPLPNKPLLQFLWKKY
jgi:membrane-associated phospholipid phosphatase